MQAVHALISVLQSLTTLSMRLCTPDRTMSLILGPNFSWKRWLYRGRSKSNYRLLGSIHLP